MFSLLLAIELGCVKNDCKKSHNLHKSKKAKVSFEEEKKRAKRISIFFSPLRLILPITTIE